MVERLGMVPDEYTPLEASGLVSAGPVVFKGVTCASNGSAGYIDIYEGQGTGGKWAARVRFVANASRFVGCPCGIKMRGGLYVDFTSNCEHATITWRPMEEGE